MTTNRFRDNLGSIGLKEQKLITKLSTLLQSCGEHLVHSNGVLCLTTQALSALTRSISCLPEDGYDNKLDVKPTDIAAQEFDKVVAALVVFFGRAPGLKIIHDSVTIVGSLSLHPFTSLTLLEIKKVPIHLLSGLNECRARLKTLICSRCIHRLQDLFETCGADMSAPMSWTSLRDAQLSHNNISQLDASLRLVPSVESIDLSHNYISTTSNFLEYLTEIHQINLGFNQLNRVPKFSMTSHSRIKHLILRNNLLDNIDGVELLVNLRLLDVGSNGLSQHKCLYVLNQLDRLHTIPHMSRLYNQLWTVDNPLAYHKQHRSLTIYQLSSMCMHKIFVLDGKALTISEHQYVVKSRVSSRRPTLLADHAITAHSLQRNASVHEGETTGDLSSHTTQDELSKSLPVSHKHRHSKKRAKMKLRHAMISELDSSDWTETSSRDSSPGMSNLKENYETLRNNYGTDWLSMFNQSAHTSSLPAYQNATEDDLYMNESTEIVQSSKHDVHDEVNEVEPEIAEPSKYMIYSAHQQEDVPVITVDTVISQTSVQGIEWNMSEVESSNIYGEECEPLVVHSVQGGETELMFVSVNKRFLIEKNVEARVVDMLDLYLLSGVKAKKLEFSLEFAYVRKDRRSRRYVMETSADKKILDGLLRPFMAAYIERLRASTEHAYECLKCNANFTVKLSPGKHAVRTQTCPKCKCELVIEVSNPSSTMNTPVGSYSSGSEVRHKSSTPVSNGNAAKTHNKKKGGNKSEVIKSLFTSSPLKPPAQINKVASLPCLDSLVDEKSNVFSQSYNQSMTMNSDKTNLSRYNNYGKKLLKRNSIAEIGNRSGGIFLDFEEAKEATENYVEEDIEKDAGVGSENVAGGGNVGGSCGAWSSESDAGKTGSDITILSNPSTSSIAVLSDPNLAKSEPLKFSFGPNTGIGGKVVLKSTKKNGRIDENFSEERHESINAKRVVTSDNYRKSSVAGDSIDTINVADGNHSNGEENDLSTSPLSSSICNSMVSSVYVNSMLTENSEQTDKNDIFERTRLGSCDSLRTLEKPEVVEDVFDSGALEAGVSIDNTRAESKTEITRTDLKDKNADIPDKSGVSVDENFAQGHSNQLKNKTGVKRNPKTKTFPRSNKQKGKTESQQSGGSIHTSHNSYFNDKASAAEFKHIDTAKHSTSLTTDNNVLSSLETLANLKYPVNGGESENRRNSYDADDVMASTHMGEHFTNASYEPNVPHNKTLQKQPGLSETTSADPQASGSSHRQLCRTTVAGLVKTTIQASRYLTGVPSPSDLILSGGQRFYGSHHNLTDIDHRLKLYFEMILFIEANEECRCMLQCGCVQYMKAEEFDAMLLVSTHNIFVIQVLSLPDCNQLEKCLKLVDKQPHTAVHFIDIGLGSQSFRLEFGHVTGSYTFVVSDEALCRHFVGLLTGILQSTTLSAGSNLEAITKSNQQTSENLDHQVLSQSIVDADLAGIEPDSRLLIYAKVYLSPDDPNISKDQLSSVSLALTKHDIFVLIENHQWPLPRLQAPPTDLIKGQQFTVVEHRCINQILQLALSENKQQMRVEFVGDDNVEHTWYVVTKTRKTSETLVELIRTTWEVEFGVALEVGVFGGARNDE